MLEQKELKVASLSQEVNGLRSQVRSKDRVIFGFKRELSSMVHIGLPKDLEQAVKVRPRVEAEERTTYQQCGRVNDATLPHPTIAQAVGARRAAREERGHTCLQR